MKQAVHLLGRTVRLTGQKLDRLGLKIGGNEIYRETWSRHRSVMNLFDKVPIIEASAWVAPNAAVIGEVSIDGDSSVWYGAVVRGDKNQVKIGANTNIQDRAVISTAGELESGFPASVHIGDNVTVGHGALLTSCVVKDNSLIGQGAVVSAGAEIGSNTIIAAGAVVLPDTLVPDNQLWAGNPAKFIRNVTEQEIGNLAKSADFYAQLSKEHSDEHVDDSDLHNQVKK